MSEMLRRVEVAQATLDAYRGKELVWGRTDCARLAAYSARRMGWPISLASFGSYETAAGAARVLKRNGCADMGELVDKMGLPRIPPASALPADIVAVQGDGLGGLSLTVALGNGRLVGFRGGPAAVLQPLLPPLAAWRV